MQGGTGYIHRNFPDGINMIYYTWRLKSHLKGIACLIEFEIIELDSVKINDDPMVFLHDEFLEIRTACIINSFTIRFFKSNSMFEILGNRRKFIDGKVLIESAMKFFESCQISLTLIMAAQQEKATQDEK